MSRPKRKITGQSITEFIVIFPAMLFMLSSLIFFTRLLILKQRSVVAVRYIAWYAGRHDNKGPDINVVKSLFFNTNSNVNISHPEPVVGFAGKSLGELGSVLGNLAGIKGTGIEVAGDNYPFSYKRSHLDARHFVFMGTWKGSGSVGKALKYALWAIAVAKSFKGSSRINLKNPSIKGK